MKVYLQISCLMVFGSFYSLATEKFAFLPLKSVPPCPPFEMYKICLSNCSTCEERGHCISSDCSEGGCDCIPQFVRLTPGGPCESIHKCPIPECGENEVFRECGPVCERCDFPNCRVIICEHKCYCKEGFKRNADKKCIPMEECPQKECALNEELRDIGPEDGYCLHADSEKDYGGTQNKTQCYCKPGMKRNTMGSCMDEKFCSVIKCLRNEVYDPCPKKCGTTCRTYGDPNCVEDDECYPGCFCPEGHVMNDFRRCVRFEDCPLGSNPLLPTLPPKLETNTQKFTSPTISSTTQKITFPTTSSTIKKFTSSTTSPTTRKFTATSHASITTSSKVISTADSSSTTTEWAETNSPVNLKSTEAEIEYDDKEDEDLSDEDVPVVTETPENVMVTTPIPKSRPKQSGRGRWKVRVRVSSKSKPKSDGEDNEENS